MRLSTHQQILVVLSPHENDVVWLSEIGEEREGETLGGVFLVRLFEIKDETYSE